MIQYASLKIPKGMKKCNFYFYCFCLDFFIRNENITFKECKQKTVSFRLSYKPSKWVARTSCHGQTLINECSTSDHLPTLKACNSAYMQYYFKRFFVLQSSEIIFSFLIKRPRQKAIEIEIAFFNSLGKSLGMHIGSFLLCFTYPSSLLLQTDSYIDE